MIALSFVGLTWCGHIGWAAIFEDGTHARQLRVGLRLPDAMVLGEELVGHRTERTGLYQLVGGLLTRNNHRAALHMDLARTDRADARLILDAPSEEQPLVVSIGDAVVLALREGLPVSATVNLMDAFAVSVTTIEVTPVTTSDEPSTTTEVPPAFRRALE